MLHTREIFPIRENGKASLPRVGENNGNHSHALARRVHLWINAHKGRALSAIWREEAGRREQLLILVSPGKRQKLSKAKNTSKEERMTCTPVVMILY
jgi:hypothetical protein